MLFFAFEKMSSYLVRVTHSLDLLLVRTNSSDNYHYPFHLRNPHIFHNLRNRFLKISLFQNVKLMNSESERDANPGPSSGPEEQLSGLPQRAPGPDNCPISPSEEAEEPAQETSLEYWMSPERTTLYFGDWVLARTSKHAKPWPARIDFVNGDLCPTRRQHRLPHMGTVPYDLDFK